MDDGPGYPTNMLGRIGDPFVRNRRSDRDRKARPEYEGMGLGLFIAKTLLERSGAELSFANGSDRVNGSAKRRGAVVEVVWPSDAIIAPDQGTRRRHRRKPLVQSLAPFIVNLNDPLRISSLNGAVDEDG